MYAPDDVQAVLIKISHDIGSLFVVNKYLISENGFKHTSSRRTMLIQNPVGDLAVLRIAYHELHRNENTSSRMYPKMLAHGTVYSDRTIWYYLEEYIDHDPDFNFGPESIRLFFASYLPEKLREYEASDHGSVLDELEKLIATFSHTYSISEESKHLITTAAQKYSAVHESSHAYTTNLDLIESNVLVKGDRFYVIDQEFMSTSHVPIIEMLRFIYYHLAVLPKNKPDNIENLQEYAFTSMLLPQSIYALIIQDMNAQFYHEDQKHLPFLITVMYMYEMNLQHDVHLEEVTPQLRRRVEQIIHFLLSPYGTRQFFMNINNGVAESELTYLRESLEKIHNSKTYTLWQKYCDARDALLKKKAE